jgi:hypothetical protein
LSTVMPVGIRHSPNSNASRLCKLRANPQGYSSFLWAANSSSKSRAAMIIKARVQ